MSDGNRMRPDLDIGPCWVKGSLVAKKSRVMWEDGTLYVVRTPQDVVSVECSERPRQERGQAQPYIAHTRTGEIRFQRGGCACAYRLGDVNGFALMNIAQPLP